MKIVEEALNVNNTIATANRADFDRAAVRVINFMSPAGRARPRCWNASWWTSRASARRAEGDVQGELDADRLAHLHVPVTQLNTDPGFGGECDLDANMVRSAIGVLPLHEDHLVVIENVATWCARPSFGSARMPG